MSNVKKQGFFEISGKAVKLILCFLVVSIAFVFIYYGAIKRSNPLDSEPVQHIEHWTVIDEDGNEYKTGRNYILKKEYDKGFTLYSTIPMDVADNEYLVFLTRKDVSIYINGELRDDFIEKRDVNIPGGSIKRFYMMVPLYSSDAGAEIKMVRTVPSKDAQLVPDTIVTTRYGAFEYLLHNYGPSCVLALIVLIFAVVVIIVSMVLRFCYRMKIDMLYGALGIFIISSWIISDSFLFPFIFGVYHVDGALNYMLCLLIPIAPAIYLNSIQQGRYKKSLTAIMLISSINAVIWPVLHFTGIYSFYNIVPIVNTIFGLIAIAAIIILIVDAKRGNIREYRYTFIGFLGFLICCLIQLIVLIIKTVTNDSIPMVIGLGVLLAFVVIQQVDDLRRINMEKQRAIDISEAKTKFLASMSHEIRTPINSILGMNEMILRENNDHVIAEYSRNIKSSGKMLLMLVNDVLDFSKIEAGKLEITEARFFMSEMLYDVISLVKERADEKSLELVTEINDEIPNEIISDEFRIRQILVNLINNAVKYTDKGMIKLRLGGSYTDDGYMLSMRVSDTGKGIREEDQEHLFEAFTRANEKENVNIEGTGLGLAIVKSIVTSMNGEVGVESEYGAGSEFWVKLPVNYVSKDPLNIDFMENKTEYETVPETSDFVATEAKVLAVDDNQSNLTIVRLFLKRTGIKPDLCSNGKRAIELCKEKKYDLILLDHMMPAPDGIETLRIIRSDEASLNKDTKVVVLTANAVAGSRKLYMDAGFDDYLTKPLEARILEQTVKNMLPKEKVKEVIADEGVESKQEESSEEMSPLKKRLTAIEGFDYETALLYCAGDEEILEDIIKDVAAEGSERSERMRKNLEANDIDAYRIDAHTIKSTMATIGLSALSERAKRHEFAAKENDTGFIFGDSDEFLKEYLDVCNKLKG